MSSLLAIPASSRPGRPPAADRHSPLAGLGLRATQPVLDTVVISSVHVYVSQTDKGEVVIGAALDGYTAYSQRGSGLSSRTLWSIDELFPISRGSHDPQWGGVVDTCPDAGPIITLTPGCGLYFNGGLGNGGFKATPGSGWVFAHTIASTSRIALNAAFSPRALSLPVI